MPRLVDVKRVHFIVVQWCPFLLHRIFQGGLPRFIDVEAAGELRAPTRRRQHLARVSLPGLAPVDECDWPATRE